LQRRTLSEATLQKLSKAASTLVPYGKGGFRGIDDNKSIKQPVIKSSVLILRPPPLQRRTLSEVVQQAIL